MNTTSLVGVKENHRKNTNLVNLVASQALTFFQIIIITSKQFHLQTDCKVILCRQPGLIFFNISSKAQLFKAQLICQYWSCQHEVVQIGSASVFRFSIIIGKLRVSVGNG